MSQQLYFAYGSNLNQQDFDERCSQRGFPQGLLKFHCKANLPDFDSNRWTPVYRIFNAAGERLLELTISDLYARFGAEMGASLT